MTAMGVASRTTACPLGKRSATPWPSRLGRMGALCLRRSMGPTRPSGCGQVPAVATLRQVWEQQFVVRAGPPTD
jgi:hypothetical protein